MIRFLCVAIYLRLILKSSALRKTFCDKEVFKKSKSSSHASPNKNIRNMFAPSPLTRNSLEKSRTIKHI